MKRIVLYVFMTAVFIPNFLFAMKRTVDKTIILFDPNKRESISWDPDYVYGKFYDKFGKRLQNSTFFDRVLEEVEIERINLYRSAAAAKLPCPSEEKLIFLFIQFLENPEVLNSHEMLTLRRYFEFNHLDTFFNTNHAKLVNLNISNEDEKDREELKTEAKKRFITESINRLLEAKVASWLVRLVPEKDTEETHYRAISFSYHNRIMDYDSVKITHNLRKGYEVEIVEKEFGYYPCLIDLLSVAMERLSKNHRLKRQSYLYNSLDTGLNKSVNEIRTIHETILNPTKN